VFLRTRRVTVVAAEPTILRQHEVITPGEANVREAVS
jgi:hypothetical protein